MRRHRSVLRNSCVAAFWLASACGPTTPTPSTSSTPTTTQPRSVEVRAELEARYENAPGAKEAKAAFAADVVTAAELLRDGYQLVGGQPSNAMDHPFPIHQIPVARPKFT